MSFQAKRLRVQLPCGEATVIEEGVQQGDAPAGFCRVPSLCGFPSNACLCTAVTPWGCQRFFSCDFAASRVCHPATICGLDSNCGIVTGCPTHSVCDPSIVRCPDASRICPAGSVVCGGGTIRCPGGSEQPIDPGTILVDPEHLPAFREALESQLAEIDKAEKALKKREK